MPSKVNPLNPKAVTRKRMEEAGEEESSAPAAPAKTGSSVKFTSGAKPTTADKAKKDAGLAAAIKKRGY